MVLVPLGLPSSACFKMAGPNLDRYHGHGSGLGSAFFKKAALNLDRDRGKTSIVTVVMVRVVAWSCRSLVVA